MLQPSLPGFPPLLPCLLCSVQGLRQTVPNSFLLSLSFLHQRRAPCSGHRPQPGSAKPGTGDHSMGAWKMQEYESCRSRKSVWVPQDTAQETRPWAQPCCPSKELATVCWPCRTWSDVCPWSIALCSAEFPTPTRERMIPCLFALVCF